MRDQHYRVFLEAGIAVTTALALIGGVVLLVSVGWVAYEYVSEEANIEMVLVNGNVQERAVTQERSVLGFFAYLAHEWRPVQKAQANEIQGLAQYEYERSVGETFEIPVQPKKAVPLFDINANTNVNTNTNENGNTNAASDLPDGWETYANETYGYEISYPANDLTEPEEREEYTRIQNYVSTDDPVGLVNDEYYLEVVITEPACEGQVENGVETTFGGRTGLRGNRPEGGDTGGPGRAACILLEDTALVAQVTAADLTYALQDSILDTLSVEADETTNANTNTTTNTNENVNENTNSAVNENENSNTNATANLNENVNENANGNSNENVNSETNENVNANTNESLNTNGAENVNVPGEAGSGSAGNENANTGVETNENENVNAGPPRTGGVITREEWLAESPGGQLFVDTEWYCSAASLTVLADSDPSKKNLGTFHGDCTNPLVTVTGTFRPQRVGQIAANAEPRFAFNMHHYRLGDADNFSDTPDFCHIDYFRGAGHSDIYAIQYTCDDGLYIGIHDDIQITAYVLPPSWDIPANIDELLAQLDEDSDGDSLTNEREIELGTDPYNADTDGDGFNDATEVRSGHDPLAVIPAQRRALA